MLLRRQHPSPIFALYSSKLVVCACTQYLVCMPHSGINRLELLLHQFRTASERDGTAINRNGGGDEEGDDDGELRWE